MTDARRLSDKIRQYNGKPLKIMEVCGSHTHAAASLGVKNILPRQVRLISGPGCPVCAADDEYISMAAALAGKVRVMSFGDMAGAVKLMYPGAAIETKASPLAAVAEAAKHPEQEIVFLSVGFETTNPVCALSVLRAAEMNLKNYSLLAANKTMPAIMEWLADERAADCFLLPGHVCAAAGTGFYEYFCNKYRIKGCVAGFDALNITAALCMLLYGNSLFSNVYSAVRREGNPAAMQAVSRVFEPCDAVIRGVGSIAGCGLKLKNEFQSFDAAVKFGLEYDSENEKQNNCRCGDIICGKASPFDCPLFGTGCTPDTPCGPCMVSSEGACMAAYKYPDIKRTCL